VWRWQSWPPEAAVWLDRLAKRPKASVIVCEGEKAAEAAASLLPDHVWLKLPNESQSAGKADWSPVHRRDVTIWPDADDPGDKYADTLARLLAPIAASAKRLAPPMSRTAGMLRTPLPRAGTALAPKRPLLCQVGQTRSPEPSGDAAEAPRRRRHSDELLDLIEGHRIVAFARPSPQCHRAGKRPL
jgi:putative DNA primase/helicase